MKLRLNLGICLIKYTCACSSLYAKFYAGMFTRGKTHKIGHKGKPVADPEPVRVILTMRDKLANT